jgi:hypothetical protein
MIDAQDFISKYEHHAKTLAQANEGNKAVVFDALATADITAVTVEFDGEGDSGQIADVTARAGETQVDIPTTPVTIRRAWWGNEALAAETPLSEAIEALCYDYLEQEHGGWENNDGAFGSFEFDVAGRAIQLEFNGRFTDVATTTHDF